jgi:DNA/RNA-binding domain of Phe-tRNA-synthetase-like protein
LAEGVQNGSSHPLIEELSVTASSPSNWPAWAEPHLEAWREAYRAFGAKPQRTPSSAEALIQRLRRDGSLPAINAVVDLYNLLSIRFAIPIGGENIDAYVSSPILTRAASGDVFDTTREGAPYEEVVPAGEVVWRDDRGVTCRRWNWRQGVRTRIDLSTTRMWFVLERLEPMPIEALHDAGRALASTLRMISPGATVSATRIGREGLTPGL